MCGQRKITTNYQNNNYNTNMVRRRQYMDNESTFKFVCREDEQKIVINAIQWNQVVIYPSQSDSGLTHFLKYVMQLLWQRDAICYYIDGESEMPIAKQIIGQTLMFSETKSSKAKKRTVKQLSKDEKSNIVFSFLASCLYVFDALPFFPNIGSITNNLVTSIKETFDVDNEHINDFKPEKAIAQFCNKLEKSDKYLILLIDNPVKLNSDEQKFLEHLIRQHKVHVLLTLNPENILYKREFVSKYLSGETNLLKEIPSQEIFERPNNILIEKLYECYGAIFLPERLSFYERTNRNIHIIMSDIYGLPSDQSHVDEKFLFLLKVLITVGRPVPKNILFAVLRSENVFKSDKPDSYFQNLCDQACNKRLIIMETYFQSNEETYIFNKNFTIEISIGFAEKQSIISATISVMDDLITKLSVPLLEFAIENLEHDYSHAKEYILMHAQVLSKDNLYSLSLLDKLNYFDNVDDLIYVISIYYDCGIYDRPYNLLKTHKSFSRKHKYMLAEAIITERLHIDNYVEKLEKLFDQAKTSEEKCLIATVLFVAYLNSDGSKKYQCFFDSASKYYYESFNQCKYYYYLLRNISYYIEDVDVAMSNYEDCLYAFKGKDVVNYNRTISNYMCYLMRNDVHSLAKKRLDAISDEAKQILDYNDISYSYLNINYGIYLMRYTQDDPTYFFSSIPFSAGTTETPYIYSRVNLALYYLLHDTSKALCLIKEVETQVKRTSVPRTKQFYAINRALIEFANGIFPAYWLEIIRSIPIRGNQNYANELYQEYYYLKENNISFNKSHINKLGIPGYIFYRYFKSGVLLL